MRYPKIVTFRLFGYTLDILLDKNTDRQARMDEVIKDLKNWSDGLGELEPVDENVIADYEPTYPCKPIKKAVKKAVKKVAKKPVKKTSKK